jgi:hypothetical protein
VTWIAGPGDAPPHGRGEGAGGGGEVEKGRVSRHVIEEILEEGAGAVGRVVVLRGLPGSGKSSFASALTQAQINGVNEMGGMGGRGEAVGGGGGGCRAVICSADHCFDGIRR